MEPAGKKAAARRLHPSRRDANHDLAEMLPAGRLRFDDLLAIADAADAGAGRTKRPASVPHRIFPHPVSM